MNPSAATYAETMAALDRRMQAWGAPWCRDFPDRPLPGGYALRHEGSPTCAVCLLERIEALEALARPFAVPVRPGSLRAWLFRAAGILDALARAL